MAALCISADEPSPDALGCTRDDHNLRFPAHDFLASWITMRRFGVGILRVETESRSYKASVHATQEFPDLLRDLNGVSFEREVTRIKQLNLGARVVAPIGLRAGWEEE